MTLTDATPKEGRLEAAVEPAPGEPAPQARPSGWAGLVGTADHKVVGRAYLVASLVLLAASFVLSALVGFEGADLEGYELLDGDTFFQVFTLSQLGVVLLGVLPAFVGLALHVLPLQVGASSVAFPRAAAGSFWLWLLGAFLLVVGYAINGGPGGGDAEGVLLSLAAAGMVVVGLLVASACLVATVATLRAPGMSLLRVPAFAWSMLVAGSVWLLTLPVLGGNLLLMYVDADHGGVLFGQAIAAWPQLRWIVAQPAVFSLAIPVLGIAAEVVPVMARRRAASHPVTLGAIALFGALSFGPWAQVAFHPRLVEQALYVVVSFVLVLPALAVLGGLADTLRRGRPRAASPLPAALIGVLAVLAAALAGAAHAFEPLRLQGTVWGEGVANLVVGAAVAGLVAGLMFWGPKMWGHRPVEPLGLLDVLIVAGGVTLFGGGALLAGGLGQVPAWPTGLPEAVEGAGELGSVLAGVGAALLVVAVVVVLLAQLPAALRRGRPAGADPWEGHTLEWAVASPPPYENFEADVPPVGSATPLLDAREPRDEVR